MSGYDCRNVFLVFIEKLLVMKQK